MDFLSLSAETTPDIFLNDKQTNSNYFSHMIKQNDISEDTSTREERRKFFVPKESTSREKHNLTKH
jgi:hypothetical protein